jgi:TPR repeat protein
MPKDQAMKWLQKSATAGHLASIVRLAKSLGEDSASKADQEASWKWYSQAAEAGYWRALVDVGVLFEFGFSKYKPSFLGKNHAKAWDAWDRAIAIAGLSDFYAVLPLSKEELPPRPSK